LLKTDGYPTYHLANVIDDHLMEITHIIRGEEWLSSVPKHLLLYQYFGWTPPLMAHVPLIFNPDRTKMKKRDIKSLEKTNINQLDPDVESYKNKGYEKEALVNYLALLGWNPGEGDERQIFTLDELIKEFSLERVNKSAAIFDLKKLNWINNEHIKRLPNQHFLAVLKNDLSNLKIPIPNDEYLIKVIDLIKSRVHFINEFFTTCSYFFIDPQHYDEQILEKNWKDDSARLLMEFCEEISTIKDYTAIELEIKLQKIAEKNNTSNGSIIHPVRLAVSGVGTGPSLFELLQVLGPEVVDRRIRRAIEQIPKLVL
jgi:glutamyl-tRNA synthetase